MGRSAIQYFAVIGSKHDDCRIQGIMGFQQDRKHIEPFSSGAQFILKNGGSSA
jgi:hypothetical protein